MRHRIFPILAFLFVLCGGAAFAQPPRAPVEPQSPDFLFGRPSGSVSIRGSWLFAHAGSDWYDFVTDQLTVDKGDFNAPGIAADVAVSLTPRLDAVAGVAFSRASVSSEYRDFVDNNRLPITQTTGLSQVGVTGSLRYDILERGRQVSAFAWIPRRVVPYVGAGGGALWYRLRQTGDFVDFVDFSVFPDVFESEGWTPTGHVMGGLDLKLLPRLYVTVDARYVWAAGELGRQWIDFEPIDLSGLRTSAGINFVF